jgi:hypothetical protein
MTSRVSKGEACAPQQLLWKPSFTSLYTLWSLAFSQARVPAVPDDQRCILTCYNPQYSGKREKLYLESRGFPLQHKGDKGSSQVVQFDAYMTTTGYYREGTSDTYEHLNVVAAMFE